MNFLNVAGVYNSAVAWQCTYHTSQPEPPSIPRRQGRSGRVTAPTRLFPVRLEQSGLVQPTLAKALQSCPKATPRQRQGNLALARKAPQSDAL